MINAIIDMASNTIRLSVYKFEDGEVKTLFTKKAMVGLAEYATEGYLKKAGIERACFTLNKFKEALSSFEIESISVFATASLRNVSNTNEALKIIKEKTGITVEIISGEEEARLDFIGANHAIKVDSGILVDIGGGSTELVIFENNKILKAVSIPLGSLNTFSKYINGFIPTEEEMKKIKKAVLKQITDTLGKTDEGCKIVCGVGGSIRATSKLNNDIFDLPISNNIITFENLKEIIKIVTKDEKEGLDIILQIVPDRIRTIVTGMVILKTICKHFGSEEIIVSNFGVREGYYYSKILGEK